MNECSLDILVFDFMDLITFTLSRSFTEKWRFKYGERLIKLFQLKIINSLKSVKNIKLKSLFKYLNKDSGYSEDVIRSFLQDIDYEIYHPVIVGVEDDIKKRSTSNR